MKERLYLYILIVSFIYGNVSAESYRLPNTIAPEHYDLKILTHVDPNENFKFIGNVVIQINILENTKAIVLHSRNLNITEKEIRVKVLDNTSDTVDVTNVTYVKDDDFLVISVDKYLKKDYKYELSIPYKGKLDTLHGFYRSSYTNKKTGEKEWLAVTQFEPTSARRAFPCFDEPILKATFSIILGRHENFTAISNMPLLESKPIENMKEWYWDVFEKSVPMSTYLVAFIISKFKYVESPKTYSNTIFKIWAREDAINQTQYASEVGPKILAHYEKYFDIPFPLPKQDMVAIPDFNAGAMENWGLITYRENSLLFKPNVSSVFNKHRVANVIAHELAHQWFGNLVTMKWWTDLWLNEGFATYVATLGINFIHPEWNVVNDESVGNLLAVFSLDALNTSHPISIPIKHASEIDQIFDVISYKKGSAVIRMINIFLGEEVFRKGISNYLKKYKYGNAEQDNLWETLTEVAREANIISKDMSIKEIMDSWTTQTGYPIIHVERDYEKNSAEINQTRYFSRSCTTSNENQTWWVPLSYFNSDSEIVDCVPKEWLKGEPSKTIENIAKQDSWVIMNTNMSGIYRINYDINNWELIIKEMNGPNFKKIPPLNRLQLLSDSMELASSGHLSYDFGLRLLQYIKQEDEFLPWEGFTSGVASLSDVLRNTEYYGLYKKYIRNLVTPAFNRMNVMESGVIATPEKLDAVDHQLTLVSMACGLDLPNCKKPAKKRFQNWMEKENPDEDNDIPVELRSTVYCIGIRAGGEEEWDFLWERYLKANVASEKDRILGTLSCTTEVWLLKRYLKWSIDENSGIKQQDSSSVFRSVASSSIGYYVAKSFLYDKIKEIKQYFKDVPTQIGGYIRAVSSQISTKQEQREFTKWLQEYEDELKEASISISQAKEAVSIKLEWADRNLDNVINILKTLTKK